MEMLASMGPVTYGIVTLSATWLGAGLAWFLLTERRDAR